MKMLFYLLVLQSMLVSMHGAAAAEESTKPAGRPRSTTVISKAAPVSRPAPASKSSTASKSNAPSKSTAQKGLLELDQKHRLYSQVKVTLGEKAVKIQSLDRDFTFVCKAPKWDAVSFSDKRKIVYVYPYSSWSKNGIKSAISLETNDAYHNWPKILKSREKYAGVEATIYVLPSDPNQKTANSVTGEYWVASGKGYDKNVLNFLQAFLDMPHSDGVPVRFVRWHGSHSFGFGLKYNFESNPATSWLSTSRSRRVPEKADTFRTPTDYKTVTDGEIVVPSQELNTTLGDLLK